MSNRVEAASSRSLAAYSAAYLAASGVLAAVFAVISVAPGRVFARVAGVVAAVSARLAVFESLPRSSAESFVAPEPAFARLSGAPGPALGEAVPVAAAVSDRPARLRCWTCRSPPDATKPDDRCEPSDCRGRYPRCREHCRR